MSRSLLGLLALAAALAVAPSAEAQSAATHVRSRLDAARQTLRSQGFRASQAFQIDRLDDRAEATVTLSLDADRAYVLVGTCDADCADLDLWLYDENDNLIDSDTSTDATPVVRVTPRWPGTFSVRVRMVACAAEPCVYGLGVFGN